MPLSLDQRFLLVVSGRLQQVLIQHINSAPTFPKSEASDFFRSNVNQAIESIMEGGIALRDGIGQPNQIFTRIQAGFWEMPVIFVEYSLYSILDIIRKVAKDCNRDIALRLFHFLWTYSQESLGEPHWLGIIFEELHGLFQRNSLASATEVLRHTCVLIQDIVYEQCNLIANEKDLSPLYWVVSGKSSDPSSSRWTEFIARQLPKSQRLMEMDQSLSEKHYFDTLWTHIQVAAHLHDAGHESVHLMAEAILSRHANLKHRDGRLFCSCISQQAHYHMLKWRESNRDPYNIRPSLAINLQEQLVKYREDENGAHHHTVARTLHTMEIWYREFGNTVQARRTRDRYLAALG